jgi:hypothetical protein
MIRGLMEGILIMATFCQRLDEFSLRDHSSIVDGDKRRISRDVIGNIQICFHALVEGEGFIKVSDRLFMILGESNLQHFVPGDF